MILSTDIVSKLKVRGCEIVVREVTGSTNDDAKELARSGAPEKTVVVATRQLAGRGRLGRTWVSPEGGLYISFVFRPQAGFEAISSLGLVLGLGVLDALYCLGAKQTQLKWPNDIVAPQGKLCGILTETVCRASRVEAIIVGMGINVNRSLETPTGVTTLSDLLGEEQDLAGIAAALIDGVCSIYEEWLACASDFGCFSARYTDALVIMGEEVCVRRIDGHVEARGLVKGVDSMGRLLVGDAAVVAGDVTLREV
ncbi:MAG: biotin--[acetyl-CoA-carboxylase] ligase [Actinobacteria bacterium]|nr:biotin--[acetyl-CoA-carboxylase] ligase [Actinomycetota bacterium]